MTLARDDGDGARLVVRVKPKSSKEGVAVEAIAGVDVVVVRVNAPPIEGRANERVRELVAERLGVPRGCVTIARGEGAREKDLRIDGLSADVVDGRLRAL